MAAVATIFLVVLAAVAALPTFDFVIKPLDPGPRYQYMQGPDGNLHLVDLWLKVSDLAEAARYEPDTQNLYHLFTRQNPEFSEPLLLGSESLLAMTKFNPNRRTIILLHGWMDSIIGDINTVLITAFLAAEDVNVIAVDWTAGGGTVNYIAAVTNTVTSGVSVARFINWLNTVTGKGPEQYHIVGHSLGGHQAGIIGRNINGDIAYVTALDPALPGWITNDHKLRSDDAVYTEVIHINAGLLGYMRTLGDEDFYPDGGNNKSGCSSQECDYVRCLYNLAESITSDGFTGARYAGIRYAGAMFGNCFVWGSLKM